MNEVANDIVWRGMTRAQLDAAMNNSAAVANSAQKLAEWTERTARLRERNRIDLFRCGGGNAPLYSKEIFGCMAEGPLAVGFDAAVVGYTLAPEARLTEIVAEIRAAVRWRDGLAVAFLRRWS